MEAFEQVHELVLSGLEQGAYPCAALAVGIGQEVFLKRTYGCCTEHTLFDMASVTKILSPTMIALSFLEDGLLKLSDRVADFFPDAPADKRDITILHLLTHTSGIPDHVYFSDYTDDPAQAAKVILNHPLEQAPGGEPIYTCLGYILLGKILEQTGGAPLDVLAQSHVFEPLGMTRTGYHPQGDAAPTEADPATGIPFQGVVSDRNARFLGGISANAGVFSDLNDMILFAKMLACNGAAYLSPATIRAAIADYTPDSRGEHRGLGFLLASGTGSFLGDRMSLRSYGHTGFTGTSIAIDPETGLWVVLLTNRICPTRTNTRLFSLRPLIHNAAAAEAHRLLSGVVC